MKSTHAPEIKKQIENLYQNIDGFTLSKIGREKMPYEYVGHEYGEATFDSFLSMVKIAKPKKTDFFVDLGSGLGKKVFMVSLIFNVQKAVGIEEIDTLYSASINALKQIQHPSKQRIIFVHDDYYHYNFSDATLVYISIEPNILQAQMKGKLFNLLHELKSGTRVITSNIPIMSKSFKLITALKANYLTGTGTMYLHQKVL